MKKTIKILIAAALVTVCFSVLGFAVSASPYTDVPDSSWYSASSEYCFNLGYISTTGNGNFSPNVRLTRAMFVQILYSYADTGEKYAQSSFSDVGTGKWYSNSVEWAYQHGYASGTGTGVFSPNAPITREQLAVFLYAYSAKNGCDMSKSDALNRFHDAWNVSAWAFGAVRWAVANSLFYGNEHGMLLPKDGATRAAVSVVIQKYGSVFGHNWSLNRTVAKRTCTRDGVSEYVCSGCGKKRTVTTPAWHKYAKTVKQVQNCGYDGINVYYCGVCGGSYTETIPKTNSHVWNSGVVVRTATATVPGSRLYTCSVCSLTYSKEIRLTKINGAYYAEYQGYNILVANKSYPLSSSFNPGGLTSETEYAFNQLKAAAKKAGYGIYLKSGFRSYGTQKSVYQKWVGVYGQAGADRISARAGHSEHQTGLAIDVNTLDESFGTTPEGKWLAAHAHEFGFIIRYPKGKESITGYSYEPWHIRYIGPLASQIYQSGKTLEEFLGIDSRY